MAQLLYFASLRETLEADQEQLELPHNITSIGSLKQLLAQRGGAWEQAFNHDMSLLVSINQQMASDDSVIVENDEIAFCPPVTGG